MAKYILCRSKAIVGCIWALTLCACATLPTDYERAETFTFQDTESTPIGRNLAPMIAKHPGESGFYLLYRGMDAFVARAMLADAAVRSIDVQYYIFHADKTGKLIADRLLKAEMGIFVDNSELAGMLAEGFEQALPTNAYRLQLKEVPDDGKSTREVIEWTTKENGREVRFQTDPGVSAWRRVGIGLMSLLPIEGQL